MSGISSFTMEIGLLYRKQVRQYLDKLKFKEKEIEYLEHKFFTSSVFKVKGDYVDVESAKLKLVCWSRR